MSIYNLGSINADWVYHLEHVPKIGETLPAEDCANRLGGKGAIQSVAAARAGSEVHHIGAVGSDAVWAVEQLRSMGVEVTHVAIELAAPTGHALIFVTPGGENRIVIYPGTNRRIGEADIKAALIRARPGDTLLIQNETNAQSSAAQRARSRGMRVVYSAAPYDLQAVREILPMVDLLVINSADLERFTEATGVGIGDLPVGELLLTRAAEGAIWHDLKRDTRLQVSAPQVTAVDMTGSSDTLVGYFCAGRDLDRPVADCLEQAVTAAALNITRDGTLDAIPELHEVEAFVKSGRAMA